MPLFEANGITFHYADDKVDRLPFVFQHGLGADISQPMSFFGGDRPFRLISMDCVDTAEPSRSETATF